MTILRCALRVVSAGMHAACMQASSLGRRHARAVGAPLGDAERGPRVILEQVLGTEERVRYGTAVRVWRRNRRARCGCGRSGLVV